MNITHEEQKIREFKEELESYYDEKLEELKNEIDNIIHEKKQDSSENQE